MGVFYWVCLGRKIRQEGPTPPGGWCLPPEFVFHTIEFTVWRWG
jgi:hypothetical protein